MSIRGLNVRHRLRRRLGARDRGSAIVEFITIGLVLLIPLIYVMVTMFAVQRAAYAVSAASRAGGRAFVLAGSNGENPNQAMISAVDMALDDQGVGDEARPPTYTCSPACLQPGSTVTVRVVVDVPLPLPDFMSNWTQRTITVNSSHTTPYGDYRAGQ
jgi:Flp pilus assembly protein TadG